MPLLLPRPRSAAAALATLLSFAAPASTPSVLAAQQDPVAVTAARPVFVMVGGRIVKGR